MASGTADLQRDLGGAIMQSILGALLTAGYAAAAAAAIGASPNAKQVSQSVAGELTKSFASAEAVGQQYPQYAKQITAAAKTSFLQGADWAYTAGIVAIVLGAALVYFRFPRKDEEQRLLGGVSRRRHGRDRDAGGGVVDDVDPDGTVAAHSASTRSRAVDRLSIRRKIMDEELNDAAAEAGAEAIEEAVAADLLHADAVEKAEMAVALEAAAEELAAEAVIEEAAAEELAADAVVDAEAAVLLAEAAEDEGES